MDQRLRHAGFESYLPQIERERQWADRRKRVALPLFPGYLFARFSLSELPRLLRTPGLAAVVQMAGRPWPLRPEELKSVRTLVDGANRSGVEPSPSDHLAAGQEVMVVSAPFQGMRGMLHEMRSRTRVIVQLSAIRQAVMVEMERHLLRPVRIGESNYSGSARNPSASRGAGV